MCFGIKIKTHERLHGLVLAVMKGNEINSKTGRTFASSQTNIPGFAPSYPKNNTFWLIVRRC
jgi:hypothetical protein